ncbi:MAG TPA: hypothetical protein PLW27_08350 [Kiritimatiellia bacterium]|jgi:hypothetical protein|nr:hypothetical protein [Kiritimatiellia bacterium]
MNTRYQCLACGAPIPLDDINVATDVALCRACGRTSAFSLLQAAVDTASSMGEPPRGIRIERDFMGGGTTLTYKRMQRNNVPTEEIVVTGAGSTFALCATLPDEPKRFVAGWLQREIARGS